MPNSKQKGSAGEREFLDKLSQALGLPFTLKRNLTQTRGGGADCTELPQYSIEVKRCEQLLITQWWAQATRQASARGNLPVLAYRQSRRPWAIAVPLQWLTGHDDDADKLATIDLPSFAAILKRNDAIVLTTAGEVCKLSEVK